jgi:hypothetical protein
MKLALDYKRQVVSQHKAIELADIVAEPSKKAH